MTTHWFVSPGAPSLMVWGEKAGTAFSLLWLPGYFLGWEPLMDPMEFGGYQQPMTLVHIGIIVGYVVSTVVCARQAGRRIGVC